MEDSPKNETWNKIRKALDSSYRALGFLVGDPLGGYSKAVETLGNDQVFEAGMVFSILFALITGFTGRRLFSFIAIQNEFGFGRFLQMVIAGALTAVFMFLIYLAINKVFAGQANHKTCLFSTGIALVPVTLVMIVARIFLSGSYELVLIVGLFGISTTVLLIHASFLQVLRFSPQKALWLTPTLILITVYLSKVVLRAFLG